MRSAVGPADVRGALSERGNTTHTMVSAAMERRRVARGQALPIRHARPTPSGLDRASGAGRPVERGDTRAAGRQPDLSSSFGPPMARRAPFQSQLAPCARNQTTGDSGGTGRVSVNEVGKAEARKPSAESAIREVEAEVRSDGNGKDIAYLIEHRLRFIRTLRRIEELAPSRARVLDVGSHYLHVSSALRLMGYDVVGIDVGAFAEQELIRLRASRLGIDNRTIERLEAGEILPTESASFDVLVFTEILEHITFNPIVFWRRVYELGRVDIHRIEIAAPAMWIIAL
jgi:hypothetical protein